MKVSVLITTYNQEGFIGQAVSSALIQEVGFAYEIVIGEDASTDQTRAIVQELAREHPNKVRVLFRDAAAAQRDRAAGVGGKGSWVNCLQACQGEYVALLDGDDYWTDPRKLQKQVDFLDCHPDFAISFHNARVVYADGKESANPPLPQPEVLSLEDLLVVNPMPACSVVFRRGLFGELPDWFRKVTLGDWAIHIMNAQHGKIGCINEVMAAYRLHADGMWPSLGPAGQRFEMIKLLNYVDGYLGHKYRKQINAAKYVWYRQLATIYFEQGKWVTGKYYQLKSYWLRGFRAARQRFPSFIRRQVAALYAPIGHRISRGGSR